MKNFFEKTYQDNHGVYRWKSNDRVPPMECMNGNGLDDDLVDACQVVREMEQAKFLADYIANMHKRPPIPEEIFERRAAFGAGQTVVNVITGEKIIT